MLHLDKHQEVINTDRDLFLLFNWESIKYGANIFSYNHYYHFFYFNMFSFFNFSNVYCFPTQYNVSSTLATMKSMYDRKLLHMDWLENQPIVCILFFLPYLWKKNNNYKLDFFYIVYKLDLLITKGEKKRN